MRFIFPAVVRSFFPALTMAALAACATGCKQSGSSAKSSDASAMSEEDFVAKCNQRLANPQDGAAAKGMLLQFLQASDCRAAYPKVKAIAAQAAK